MNSTLGQARSPHPVSTGSLRKLLTGGLLLLAAACGGGSSSGGSQGTPPAVSSQPASLSVIAGQTATFSVVATGSAPLNYQWLKAGVGISGASAASYTTPATTLSDNGATFTVTVSNDAGSVTSQAATLTVTPSATAPSITTQPADQSVIESQAATFTVVAAGTAPLSYQWLKSGVEIGAATSASYTTPAAALGDSGSTFQVRISSSAGSLTSREATLTVTGGGGSYALPVERATLWNPGLMSIGGIPSSSWPVVATLHPSGGDDTTQINDALLAAHGAQPAGAVVLLSAGSFRVNDTYIALQTSNTVLRGAGPGLTWLSKSNGATLGSNDAPDHTPVVILGPSRWPVYQANPQLLSLDASKGATSITVADGSYFSKGMFARLDEASGATWQTDPQGRGQILASAPWTDPTTPPEVVWWVHNPGFVDDDPAAPEAPSAANNWASVGGDAASWFSRQDRVQAEIKEIAGVNGNTVTFTSPLHRGFRTSHHAQLTPPGDGGNHPSIHVSNSGLEALSVSGGSDGSIRFEHAAYTWTRNIENTLWLGEGFAIDGCFRVEIRDSYVHDGVFPYPGGGGYCLSLSQGSAELLYENNINVLDNKVMVVRSAGAGSVIGYNYMDKGFIGYNDAWNEIGLNGSHMVGGYQMLFEGNWGFNFDSDSTHGSATRHTVFRNWLRGWRSPFQNYVGCTGGTAAGCSSQEPLVDDAHNMALSLGGPYRTAGGCRYSYYFNFVGNVLGASGQMAGWVQEVSQAFNNASVGAIWMLGWDPDSPYPANDPYVASSDIRDGNWDFLSSSQRWLTTPTFTGTLPSSLYLPGKPPFFGSNPWPWVNPATGATGVLPAKARYDAGTPNVVP